MRFTAKLVTDRILERPFSRFAPDLVNAERAGKAIPGKQTDAKKEIGLRFTKHFPLS